MVRKTSLTIAQTSPEIQSEKSGTVFTSHGIYIYRGTAAPMHVIATRIAPTNARRNGDRTNSSWRRKKMEYDRTAKTVVFGKTYHRLCLTPAADRLINYTMLILK